MHNWISMPGELCTVPGALRLGTRNRSRELCDLGWGMSLDIPHPGAWLFSRGVGYVAQRGMGFAKPCPCWDSGSSGLSLTIGDRHMQRHAGGLIFHQTVGFRESARIGITTGCVAMGGLLLVFMIFTSRIMNSLMAAIITYGTICTLSGVAAFLVTFLRNWSNKRNAGRQCAW